jgi:hypothetical protein
MRRYDGGVMDTRRRLYHARITSHLTLEQIGVRTALSPTVLRHIDGGKFELLPSGVYARSYVRAFAAEVGLDPEAALAELEDLLPGAPDPVPALNAIRPDPAEWVGQLFRRLLQSILTLCTTGIGAIRSRLQGLVVWIRDCATRAHVLVASCLAAARRIERATPLREAVERAQLRLRSCQSHVNAAAQRIRTVNSNDLTARLVAPVARLDEDLRGRWNVARLRRMVGPSGGRLHASPRVTRCSAAAIDALLLLLVDAFLVLLVSWSSGIAVERLLSEAGWALGSFCAIPIVLYFLLFGGIAGSTLGSYLCGLIAPPERQGVTIGRSNHPLTLPEILRRTVRQ